MNGALRWSIAFPVSIGCAFELCVLESNMKQPMFWLVLTTLIVFGYSSLTDMKIGAEVRLDLSD